MKCPRCGYTKLFVYARVYDCPNCNHMWSKGSIIRRLFSRLKEV